MHLKLIVPAIAALGLLTQGASLPVGIVTQAKNAQLLRQGSDFPLTARQGDLLYPGDRLDGPAEVAICVVPEEVTLSQEVRVTRPDRCILPPLERDRTTGGPIAAPTRSVSRLRDEPKPSELRPSRPEDTSLVARVTHAESLAQSGKPTEAANEYRAMLNDFPEANALGLERLFVLEEEAAQKLVPKPDPAIGGKTYALLVGISKFENARVPALKYAHEDAIVFERFLRSQRGGSLAADDILLLTNEQATAAAIQTAFETLLKKTTPKDSVIILLATHGTVVENPQSDSPHSYLLAHDSDPENLASTGIRMAAVRKLIQEGLAKAARVFAFVDACRAGTIGATSDASKLKIHAAFDLLAQTQNRLFLFTASRPGEVSYEGRQYGGGHGAFSFFLLEALNGAADFDADGKISVSEVVTYVQQKVAEATVDKQHPRDAGSLDMNIHLADATKIGIPLGPIQPGLKELAIERSLSVEPQETAARIIPTKEAVDFDEALASGRLLPDEPSNAFTAFRQLKLTRQLTRDQVLESTNRLSTALEDRNQKVIQRYLRGEEQSMSKEQYTEAARTINAAIQVNGETPALVSRLQFCEAWIAMFEKNYEQARTLLESALRLDPNSAYIYNALGTAYVEQAEYDLAMKAFSEASRLAPLWPNPQHNLALMLDQKGDYKQAIAVYDNAIRQWPEHTYLIYNQGLIYQKLNLLRKAEECFRKAVERWPERPEAFNALGAVRLSRGKKVEAERLFRLSLTKRYDYLPARQNLAELVAARRSGQQEALDLLRQNLSIDPNYAPSRIALARILQKLHRGDEAAAQYRVLFGQQANRTLTSRLLTDRMLVQ